MIQNQPNPNTISELQAEIDYWKKAYEEKTFDFSGANVTVNDLPYDVFAWDANGVLIGRKSTPGEYGSKVISGTKTKGSFVRFDGKDWIVANVSGNTYILMLKKMTETTTFGSSTSYSGSTIASKCTTFQNAMSVEALSVVNSKTVQGVTAKVWIAQKTDIVNWTDNNDPTSSAWSGIRRWTGSSEDDYAVKGIYNCWCSNPYNSSYVWCIAYSGYFGGNFTDPSFEYGFRPCIEVVQS